MKKIQLNCFITEFSRIIGNMSRNLLSNVEKNNLPQIRRSFSRIDLFSKKECAGGT